MSSFFWEDIDTLSSWKSLQPPQMEDVDTVVKTLVDGDYNTRASGRKPAFDTDDIT